MSTFDTLDASAQRNVARFAIERFLQELEEQLGPPDQWQMAAANHAIAAYQCAEFGDTLRCISAGEKPSHQRPIPTSGTMNEQRLSLRSLWCSLIYPGLGISADGDNRFNLSGTHVQTE